VGQHRETIEKKRCPATAASGALLARSLQQHLLEPVKGDDHGNAAGDADGHRFPDRQLHLPLGYPRA
jgi:hypothetical protein